MTSSSEMSMKEKDEWAEKRFQRAYAKDWVEEEGSDSDLEDGLPHEVPLPIIKGSPIVKMISSDGLTRARRRAFEHPPIEPKVVKRPSPPPLPLRTGLVPGTPLVVNVYPSGAKKVAVIATDSFGGSKVVYPYGEDYLGKSIEEAMAQENLLNPPALDSLRAPPPTGTNVQVPCQDLGESTEATVVESSQDPSAAAPGASSSDYN